MKLVTADDGQVRGFICFDRAGEKLEEELVNVPTIRGSHCAGTTEGYVGPPLGGQCVRRGP